MAKWRVLVTAKAMLPNLDEFTDRFRENDADCVTASSTERLEEEELLALVGDIDGAICSNDRFTPRVFDAAPRLKVVVKWGTGVDSFDLEAAKARGIKICNTADAFTEPVADSVVGYMLAFARNLVALDRAVRAGVWKRIPGRALNEATVGVVGVGAIGSAVLRRAGAFGARLLGNDIRALNPGHVKALGVAMVPLETLLAESDFVSLNCDLNPTSRHLIGAEQFKAMKRTAVLVNASRGAVVDEPALIRALREGRIAGAGLDVYETEPLPADSPLRKLDNVMLAPHASNSSPKAYRRVNESSLDQLFAALREREGPARRPR